MNEPNLYAVQWQDLRDRNYLVICLFLGFIPGVGGLGWLLSFVSSSEVPVMVVGFLWMLAFAWSSLRASFFPCPRCGKYFRGWNVGLGRHCYATLVGRKCAHCGLRLYENS